MPSRVLNAAGFLAPRLNLSYDSGYGGTSQDDSDGVVPGRLSRPSGAHKVVTARAHSHRDGTVRLRQDGHAGRRAHGTAALGDGGG
jgi:hypothetical protein